MAEIFTYVEADFDNKFIYFFGGFITAALNCSDVYVASAAPVLGDVDFERSLAQPFRAWTALRYRAVLSRWSRKFSELVKTVAAMIPSPLSWSPPLFLRLAVSRYLSRSLSRSFEATLTYRKKCTVVRLLKMMLQKYRVQCRSRFYLSFLNSALKYWLESGIKRHLKRKEWGLQRLYGPGQVGRPVWKWCILSPGAAVVIYG